MAENRQKESFWQRIRHPYLLRLMDVSTWKSVLNIRLTWLTAFTLVTLMFLLTVALLSLLIVYTPIRTILPGYTENLRQQLVEASAKVDSLGTELEVHHRYIEMVQKVVAGEETIDTVPSVDSLLLVKREELLAAKSEAAEEYMAQYEAREKNSFQLFDIQAKTPVNTMFRPANGVITGHFLSDDSPRGIRIRTPKDENASAVLAGTVVFVNYEIDNTYTIMVQHAAYVSLYRHVGKALKKVGDAVQAGESIGICSEKEDLLFELWQNGKNINPEEVIVF